MAILIGTTKDGSSTDGRTLFPDGRNQEIHHLEKDHQTRSYSPPKTIFVVSLQGTPGAHDSNNGRLDLFKEKWRNACGSSSAFTHIEHCAAPLDTRRGYGVTWAWILCVWRARQLNEEAVIFLEDDARLFENSTDDFCDVKRRGQLLSKLPDDTFLAFLGGHTWFYKDTKVPFRQVRHSYGAYGFVVPRESIDDFYEALSSGLLQGRNKALNPEDIFYSAARRCHKSIYAFNPLIVWHEGGYSNTWGRVRGNITGLESHKQGINTSSGRKRLVTKIATRTIADQEQEMNHHLNKQSTLGAVATKCTFCEGKEMPNGDLIVPDTGEKTCSSIKAMAAGEVNGSEICAIMQKEENVCCPVHTNICTRPNCRQADPHGSTLLGKHRGRGLMLRTKQHNLAYLFVPKAGSSSMKHTLMKAGPTQQVWLSPNIGTNALDPLIFTVIRDPGERLVSAYSTIVARDSIFAIPSSGKTRLFLPATPKNSTDAAALAWKEHFQESIWKMMNYVKENGWNNSDFHWNEHIVPQVEFLRGLNVSHIGCIGSINETLVKLHLKGADEKTLRKRQYEHKVFMPSVKFGSYDMLSLETQTLIREVYDEDYALFGSLCTKNS